MTKPAPARSRAAKRVPKRADKNPPLSAVSFAPTSSDRPSFFGPPKGAKPPRLTAKERSLLERVRVTFQQRAKGFRLLATRASRATDLHRVQTLGEHLGMLAALDEITWLLGETPVER